MERIRRAIDAPIALGRVNRYAHTQIRRAWGMEVLRCAYEEDTTDSEFSTGRQMELQTLVERARMEWHEEYEYIKNQIKNHKTIFTYKNHRAVDQLVARRTAICPKVISRGENNEHNGCGRP